MPPASRLLTSTLLLSAVLAFSLPAAAEKAPASAPAVQAAPPEKPKLILAIAVDQFSADLFGQYRQHFSHGLARLQTGAVFPSGFQSHAATETCPGHATLLTGLHPARSGIIANNWFVPGISRKDKQVYCAEDERDPASSSEDPVVSSDHLTAPTLGDLMKKANPAALNVAVSAKDRAVVMMSGHTADAAYWFKGKGFTSYTGRRLSPAAEAANAALAALVAKGAGDLPVPGWCAPVDRALQLGSFSIGTFRFPLKAWDYRSFGRSPRMDAATADMAIRLLDEMALGRDDVTDLLSVSFSATDYVGHAFGSEGVEMCIQLAQLDQSVGRLLDALDARGIDYLVVLTADHGGADAPERLRQRGVPAAARLDPSLTGEALSRAVAKDTGITAGSGPLLYGAGGSGDIWLADGLTQRQQQKVIAALVARLKANPQVEAVYTAGELAKVKVPRGNPQDWTMIERVAASFNPARSGQVLMMTKRAIVPGTAPLPGFTATHGSPWDYDRRVPMLFWRKGMAPMEQAQPVETVDIAPTLAAQIGLAEPVGAWDGRCLDIDAGEADSCPR